MFLKLTRAALVFGTLLAPAAAFAQDSAPRVEYRYFGQGAYTLVIPQRAPEPPYALTGRSSSREDYWSQQAGKVIDVGQGRYVVPATR
jgi:hypothetical protein